MTESKSVQQKEYETLEDFKNGQNNFYFHFLPDNVLGKIKRNSGPFERFQEDHPKMGEELTRKTEEAEKQGKKLPYVELWKAYKIMSNLVYVDDQAVMRNGEPDNWYLSR